MKKVILMSLMAIFFAFVSSVAGQVPGISTIPGDGPPPPRVRVEVYGFDDNIQALKQVSDYAWILFNPCYNPNAKSDDPAEGLTNVPADQKCPAGSYRIREYSLVVDNPDYIYRADASVTLMESGSVIDDKAVSKNTKLSIAQGILRTVGYNIQPRNNILRGILYEGVRNTESRLEAGKQRVVIPVQKWKGTVVKSFIDAKTREVVSKGIGEHFVTVENITRADKQLLALSAFTKAALPMSNIVDVK